MIRPSEGKGRKHGTLSASFPFLFSAPRIHPGVFLLANLSLIVFVITTRRYNWKITVWLWAISFLLLFLCSPRFKSVLKKMVFVLPFLALSLFFHAFFTPGAILFGLGHLFVTREGLCQGAWITQKLAYFFWVSFALTSAVPGMFLFQIMGCLSRFPVLKMFKIRLGIIVLFLIMRWLRVLPLSWKEQLHAFTRDTTGKLGKTIKGLQLLPQILGNELIHLDRWTTLLIFRGYGEGILWIADGPFPPLRRKDILIFWGILVAWGFWIAYLI